MMRIVCRHLGVPMSAAAVPGWYTDANNTPNLIKNWTMPEWRNFTTTILGQANKWDSQFWLVPPNEFAFFDVVDQRGTRTRPNVKCEFNEDIALSVYGAHRIIDVVNLATHQFFRSHETLYDLSCTRFRRHQVRCFMEQEVRHGEKAVYAGVQA
jgi:hypothetical protein